MQLHTIINNNYYKCKNYHSLFTCCLLSPNLSMITGTTEINEKNTYHFSLMSDTQNEHCTRCGLHLSVETFKPTDFTEIHQCFCQTVPLRESRISEKAPRKMDKGPIQPFTFTRLHAGSTQAQFNSHPKAQDCDRYGHQ